jgi:FkbM family methyltransferase
MTLIQSIGKPQYLFRPRWAIRRLITKFGFSQVSNSVELPWGSKLKVDTKDTVGWALATQGMYDTVTTEVVWRLTEEGETVFDIGANVGYFTTLLAHRVGSTGKVLAFEPHPKTVEMLRENISFLAASDGNVQIINVALSDRAGEGVLDNFPNQENNTSVCFLTDKPTQNGLRVKTARGEEFIAGHVALMKIDAQWHESSVLAGFGDALRSGRIRDIVFEEEGSYPASSHKILIDTGYEILWFDEGVLGPRMISPGDRPKRIRSYDIRPSYLATRDSARAEHLLSPPGWRSFVGRFRL